MTETLTAVLPDEVECAAQAILDKACAQEMSLATAGSCTGGLLASLLTDLEGASDAFEHGLVVHTNEAKVETLGILIDLVERKEAVSEPVARAMAEDTLKASSADVELSVTGFDGPRAPRDEPGRVHVDCASEGRTTAHRKLHFGDTGRGPVRVECLRAALNMFGEALA